MGSHRRGSRRLAGDVSVPAQNPSWQIYVRLPLAVIAAGRIDLFHNPDGNITAGLRRPITFVPRLLHHSEFYFRNSPGRFVIKLIPCENNLIMIPCFCMRSRGVAVNMPACQAGERGFKSHRLRHLKKLVNLTYSNYSSGSSSVAEHRLPKPGVEGSNPFSRSKSIFVPR